jgi:hypothetical protein
MVHQHLTAGDALSKPLDMGVGINWFDFMGAGGFFARCKDYPQSTQIFPPPEDSLSWGLAIAELDKLNPGCIRYGLPPDQVLNPDGSFIKESKHFHNFDRVAGWCKRTKATLILDPFIIPELYEFPVTETSWSHAGMLNMAARDNREYAEKFVVPLIEYLVRERGWDNIAYYNPVNEPFTYGVYQTPKGGPDDYVYYVEMYAELRRALDKAGFEKIGLIGIDSCDPIHYPVYEFTARGVDIDPYIQGYSLHTYVGRYDYEGETARWTSMPMRILIDTYIQRLVKYTETRGKPMLALEFGSYHGWVGDYSSNATAQATIYTAESVLRMVNVGVRGLMYWQVSDPNENDGWWSIYHVQDGRIYRGIHTYPTYRLLFNYMRPGSKVFPLNPGLPENMVRETWLINRPSEREYPSQHIWGCALEAPDGHKHLLVLCDHPNERREVTLHLPDAWKNLKMHKLVKDPIRLGIPQGLYETGEEGTIQDTLSPYSLQVYTTSAVEALLPVGALCEQPGMLVE